jgi:hypothetical protein
MPTVDLRVFHCASGDNAAGQHVLEETALGQRESMPVWIPGLLEVNALATPLERNLTYRLKQHELNLVLSFLTLTPDGTVSARITDLRAAARHIRGFVTESVGMGMLTAAVRYFYRWNGSHAHLKHFDTLPSHLAGRYRRLGVRPDLLFLDPAESGRRMAGEARARSTKPSPRSTPLKAQLQRLDEILGWSGQHDQHPVTMAWTCLGGAALSVDLFDVEHTHRPPRQPEAAGTPGACSSQAPNWWLITATDDTSDPYRNRQMPSAGPLADFSVNASQDVDRLYATAPDGDDSQVLDGQRVRGDWVSADLLGRSTTRLFLGVLPREPSPPLETLLQERRTNEDFLFDPLQVDIFGRLIVAVSLDRRTPPPWPDVAARLT